MRQRVVDEVRALIEPQPVLQMQEVAAAKAAAALAARAPAGRQWMARLVVPIAGLQAAVGLELFKDSTQAVQVGYDPVRGSFFVDRTNRSPESLGRSERHDAKRLLDGRDITLEIWADGSTLEVFGDDGTVVISDLVYGDPAATGVALFHGAENPLLRSIALHAVRATMYEPAT